MPSVPLDRPRVPPDVARRLAALAAHRAPDTGVPPTPGGWTPRPPTPSAADDDPPVRGDGPVAAGGPAGDLPTPHDPPVPGDGRAGGERYGGAAPRSDPSADRAPGAPDAPPWRPSVASALATAAASLPTPPATRVRWAPGWRTAGAAVLVLALVAGGIALRAAAAPRGEPVAVPVPMVTRDGPGAGTGTGEPSDTADQVVVHVVGAVRQPGVVRLALGARVSDAIDAAGGGTPDAGLAGVNLARVLADGEQLVVPVLGATVPAAAPTDGLLDLNTADAAALEELPGVGPVLAGRIVQRRTERPFTSVDELDEVSGIGPALLADLLPRVRV